MATNISQIKELRIRYTGQQQVKSAVNTVVTAQKKLVNQVRTLRTRYQELYSVLMLFRFVARAGGAFVTMTDQMTLLQNRMGSMVKEFTVDQMFEKLRRGAEKTASDLQTFVHGFTQLKFAADRYGLSTDRLLKINETIANSFRITGASVQESKSAMIQLYQAIRSNRLGGDEARSIRENAPYLYRMFQETSQVPMGHFKKFLETGGVNAEIMLRSMEEGYERVDEQVKKLGLTMGQQFTVTLNNLKEEWRKLNEVMGFSDGVTLSIKYLGGAVVELTRNVDLLSVAFAALLPWKKIGGFFKHLGTIIKSLSLVVIGYVNATALLATAGAVTLVWLWRLHRQLQKMRAEREARRKKQREFEEARQWAEDVFGVDLEKLEPKLKNMLKGFFDQDFEERVQEAFWGGREVGSNLVKEWHEGLLEGMVANRDHQGLRNFVERESDYIVEEFFKRVPTKRIQELGIELQNYWKTVKFGTELFPLDDSSGSWEGRITTPSDNFYQAAKEAAIFRQQTAVARAKENIELLKGGLDLYRQEVMKLNVLRRTYDLNEQIFNQNQKIFMLVNTGNLQQLALEKKRLAVKKAELALQQGKGSQVKLFEAQSGVAKQSDIIKYGDTLETRLDHLNRKQQILEMKLGDKQITGEEFDVIEKKISQEINALNKRILLDNLDSQILNFTRHGVALQPGQEDQLTALMKERQYLQSELSYMQGRLTPTQRQQSLDKYSEYTKRRWQDDSTDTGRLSAYSREVEILENNQRTLKKQFDLSEISIRKYYKELTKTNSELNKYNDTVKDVYGNKDVNKHLQLQLDEAKLQQTLIAGKDPIRERGIKLHIEYLRAREALLKGEGTHREMRDAKRASEFHYMDFSNRFGNNTAEGRRANEIMKENKLMEEQKRLYHEGEISLREYDQAVSRLNTQFDYGSAESWNQALRLSMGDLRQNIGSETQIIRQTLTNTFFQAENALYDFTQKGKFAFKEFATSVMQDILRMTTRMLILKPLMDSLLHSAGGGPAIPLPAGAGGNSNPGVIDSVPQGDVFRTASLASYGSASASSMGGKPYTVTVNNNTSASVSTRENPVSGELEIAVNNIVKKGMYSGAYDKAQRDNFGNRRNGF